ncbi:MAG: small-conductance mechanosensitive channel, partial [Tardiphaga sp.]|nr:small-conductance mechanosensitive channel [Tardiphaga sp.]
MLRKAVCTVAFACLLLAAPVSAQQAAPAKDAAPVASALTPEQASRALETLQDDGKRNQMIETLRAIAQTAPAGNIPAAGSDAKPETKPESKLVLPLED